MPLLAQSLSENRRTLALASPIIAGFVGQMLMGWADTIMVGRVGVVPLAACAFANTMLAVPFVFGFAVLSSVSVRASLAFGGGRTRMPGEALRAGLVIGSILGICVVSAIHAALPLLPWLGQGPEINAACRNFLVLCAWSSVPVFVTTVTKNFCEALSRPWVPFWIMIAGVLLNVGLNWILIYGNLGVPAMGLDGAGWQPLLARIAVAAAIVVYMLLAPALKENLPADWLANGLFAEIRRLLAIGLPSGGMHLAEISGFAFGSLMMGWLGAEALAAHQIAITCAATTFMIPLGLSQAVSVRIGQARGAGEERKLPPDRVRSFRNHRVDHGDFRRCLHGRGRSDRWHGLSRIQPSPRWQRNSCSLRDSSRSSMASRSPPLARLEASRTRAPRCSSACFPTGLLRCRSRISPHSNSVSARKGFGLAFSWPGSRRGGTCRTSSSAHKARINSFRRTTNSSIVRRF